MATEVARSTQQRQHAAQSSPFNKCASTHKHLTCTPTFRMHVTGESSYDSVQRDRVQRCTDATWKRLPGDVSSYCGAPVSRTRSRHHRESISVDLGRARSTAKATLWHHSASSGLPFTSSVRSTSVPKKQTRFQPRALLEMLLHLDDEHIL